MHVVLDGLRGAIDGATFDRGVGQEGYAERLEREGVTAPSTWLSERPCGCAGAGDPNHNHCTTRDARPLHVHVTPRLSFLICPLPRGPAGVARTYGVCSRADGVRDATAASGRGRRRGTGSE